MLFCVVIVHIDIFHIHMMYCGCSHLCIYGILVYLTLHSICSSSVHDNNHISCLSYVPLVFSPFMVCLLLTVFHYSISSQLYFFNNLLTHLLRHTVIILSVISRLCHMWHHVHLSVPAGLRSAPVAHPWHALMPCCGRFNVLSGLLLPCCSMKRGRASALRRSTIRHPAVTVALLPHPTRLPRTL